MSHLDPELKEEIVEKCLLILTYFCIKNVKNCNLIAEHSSFKDLYTILLNFKCKY